MKQLKKLLVLFMCSIMLFTVMPIQTQAASNIKLNKTKVTLKVGKSTKLKVKGTNKKVKWSSSKKKIATVNKNGKVVAKKIGKTTITAKVSNKKYTCKVTVVKSTHKHKYKMAVVEPTCTQKGNIVYACSCGHTYKTDYGKAKGHIEIVDEAVEPTTTATGLTEGKHCLMCGCILVKQTVIPKKNSPSANSTFDYEDDLLLHTYSSVYNPYNEYYVGGVDIETTDTSETTFDLKVTFYVVLFEKPAGAPDYIKGKVQLWKAGKKGMYDNDIFTVPNAIVDDSVYVTITFKDLVEGNYSIDILGYI